MYFYAIYRSSMAFDIRESRGRDGTLFLRHGKSAGVLIGSETEDAWFEYRLEIDP